MTDAPRRPRHPQPIEGGDDDAPAAGALDQLFAEALPGVEPLPAAEPRRVLSRRCGPKASPATASTPRSGGTFSIECYDEVVTALRRDADPRLLDQLRGGTRAPEAELDLHGHTVASAMVVLEAFLARVGGEGKRCVLIVHGRGRRSVAGPVLKDAVVERLLGPRLPHRVLALATAPAAHGGPGALLVLLRRR